ncbi:MAG: tRNA (N6-threonylcarbamoyladenosine(37)-N6)-methyltransferase TrmO [Planctomycetota bacterium]
MTGDRVPLPSGLEIVGRIRSPFREKFGVPRQPGLVPSARGELIVEPPFARPEAWRGIDGFSHVWLLFLFHLDADRRGDRLTARPPRLGGEERLGVFATRTGFRPNGIGLSVVELRGLEIETGSVTLRLGGLDLVDGTPVIDVKPYLPWADAVPDARGGFAPAPPEASLEVRFSPEASAALAGRPEREALIRELLALDPRSAWHRGEAPSRYGARLEDFDLRWEVRDGVAEVVAIVPLEETPR